VVKPVRPRPGDFALATEKASAIAAPPGTAEALAAVPGIARPPAALPGTAGAPDSEPVRRAGRLRPGEWDPDPDPHVSLPVRSAERRRWTADLTSPTLAGLVLYGVGGIGKSTLASQITSRVSHLDPEWVTAVVRGETSVDGVLAGVAAALRRHPATAPGSSRAESARVTDQTDVPRAHRLTLLREHVLAHVPVLLALDDFDDNVSADSGGWKIRDPALAELIASWASGTHRGKLLITCRHPFTQPPAAGPPLGFRHVGPLSRSGAFEMAKSLPAFGRLSEQELDRAWRLLGGHPHAMKYLDSLLVTSEVGFPEVARRLAQAIGAATGDPARPMGPAAPTELPPAAAETIALAASDLLLGELQGEAPRNSRVNGAHRGHAWVWRSRRTAAVAGAAVLATAAAGVFVAWHPGSSTVTAGAGARPRLAAVLDDAAAVRSWAAAWVARQISRNAIVACDPDMCSALLAQGTPPANLLELRAATPDPLGSDVVVATAAVRNQFGGRLASVYAPGILASFGAGRLRIDVRAVAPDGAAAYRDALASDQVARRDAGRQLLGNWRLRVSASAQAELRAGQVDSRLLTTLAALAATGPVQVTAFGDSGPGAGYGMPLRSAEITAPFHSDLARLRQMITFLRAQRPPYLPARALIAPGAGGSPVLSIEFAAPSPAGLLQPEPAR